MRFEKVSFEGFPANGFKNTLFRSLQARDFSRLDDSGIWNLH